MKNLATLALLGTIGLAGCNKGIEYESNPQITTNKIVMNSGTIYAHDLNNDGRVDIISGETRPEVALYVAPEFINKTDNYGFQIMPETRPFPDSLRTLASEAIRTNSSFERSFTSYNNFELKGKMGPKPTLF